MHLMTNLKNSQPEEACDTIEGRRLGSSPLEQV